MPLRELPARPNLDNLFRLQMVAGQYAAAKETLASLHPMPASGVSPQANRCAM